MKRIFSQFRWFFREYKWRYVLGLSALSISYVLDLIPPRLLGLTADLIVSGTIRQEQLLLRILWIVGVAVLSYAANIIWGYFLFKATDEMERRSHLRIFRRLLHQGPRFYARHSTGSILGKATNDVEALGEFAGFGMVALYDATIYPLVILAMMLAISWRLTLLSFLPYPLLWIFQHFVSNKLYRLYDEQQEAFDAMNQSVLEGVAGVRVVRAYHLEEQEKQRFARRADDLRQRYDLYARYGMLYGPITGLIPALAFVVALAVGALEILAGRLSTGDLLSFSFYLNMLSWPMLSLGEFLVTAQQGSASMERVDELVREALDVEDPEDARAFPATSDIQVESLDFAYPERERGDTQALSNISFRVAAGQTLGIVGPVGAGKSSLLRQFLHFHPLQVGSIRIGGEDLATLSRSELRHHLAYVPQQSFLFSASIRDNILLGATDEDLASGAAERRLEEVLDWADLRKDLPQLPQGLDTLAGEKGIALSGGQKQRICIARALMRDADILILDDCLSAVDAITEDHVLTALRRVRAGKTTLIAAHRLSAVMQADDILVLEQGRIREEGSHAQLLAAGGWYAAMFARQQLEAEQSAAAEEAEV